MKRKIVVAVIIVFTLAFNILGCSPRQDVDEGQNTNGENIIITETGEVMEKEMAETEEASPSPSVVTLDVPLQEPPEEQVITEHDQANEVDPNDLQIVFLGDSILDNHRDGTGIAYLVGVACDANVYNLSIGGTSASLEVGEPQEHSKWTSKSLVGLTLMLAGYVNTDPIEGTRAKEIFETVDPGNTDYFVVEYGLNDFFRAVPLSSSNPLDMTTYVGALRVAVSNLQEVAPDATIILCSPHYSRFFHDGVMVGDGNVLNNGYGTLFDYKGTCEYVANSTGSVFMDAYLDLGINGYTAEDYLEDGVHLTGAGRKLYADYLSNIILKYEETKNN